MTTIKSEGTVDGGPTVEKTMNPELGSGDGDDDEATLVSRPLVGVAEHECKNLPVCESPKDMMEGGEGKAGNEEEKDEGYAEGEDKEDAEEDAEEDGGDDDDEGGGDDNKSANIDESSEIEEEKPDARLLHEDVFDKESVEADDKSQGVVEGSDEELEVPDVEASEGGDGGSDEDSEVRDIESSSTEHEANPAGASRQAPPNPPKPITVIWDDHLPDPNTVIGQDDILYLELEKLGSGGNGTVYRGLWKNEVVAVKLPEKASVDKDAEQRLNRDILADNGHPLVGLVVRPIDVLTVDDGNDETRAIITELMEGNVHKLVNSGLLDNMDPSIKLENTLSLVFKIITLMKELRLDAVEGIPHPTTIRALKLVVQGERSHTTRC